jgi:hypothetical protein
MQKNDFTDFILNKFRELEEKFAEKNEQYSTNDPLANFSTGARLVYKKADAGTMYDVTKEYLLKHISHIYNNDVHGCKIDESLTDMAIYSVILLYFHKLSKMEECRNERKQDY